MKAPPPPPKDSRSLRKWVIGCFLVVPLLCCCGPMLFARRWVDTFDYSADLDNQVTEAKKHGFPFEAKDLLVGEKTVADTDNAYLAVVAEMKKPEYFSGKWADPLKAFKPGEDAAVPSLVRKAAQVALAIAKKPGYQPKHDMDYGAVVEYPEYQFERNLVMALSKSAEQDAIDGKVDLAIQELRAIRKISEFVVHEHQVLGCLVSLNLKRTYFLTSLKVAERFGKNDQAIDQVVAMLKEKQVLPDLREGFLGEVFMGVTFTRNYAGFGGLEALSKDMVKVKTPKSIRRSGLPKGMLERGMLAAYLHHMMKLDEICQHSANWAEAGRQMDDYMTKVPTTVSNSMTQIIVPIWWDVGVAWEKRALEQKMALVAVDYMRKQRYGQLPGEIPEIADTVAGNVILYTRTAGGFKIYSAGKNKQDEGGPKGKSTRKSDDFGFEYPFVEN